MENTTAMKDMKMLDLSQYQSRPENIHPAEMSVRGRDKIGRPTVELMTSVGEVCKLAGLPSSLPVAFRLWHKEENERVLHAIPTMTKDPAYLAVTHSEDGQTIYFQMKTLLRAMKVVIPRKSRFVLPVKIDEKTAALVLDFSEGRFEPIEEGTRKKKQEQAAPSNATAAK